MKKNILPLIALLCSLLSLLYSVWVWDQVKNTQTHIPRAVSCEDSTGAHWLPDRDGVCDLADRPSN